MPSNKLFTDVSNCDRSKMQAAKLPPHLRHKAVAVTTMPTNAASKTHSNSLADYAQVEKAVSASSISQNPISITTGRGDENYFQSPVRSSDELREDVNKLKLNIMHIQKNFNLFSDKLAILAAEEESANEHLENIRSTKAEQLALVEKVQLELADLQKTFRIQEETLITSIEAESQRAERERLERSHLDKVRMEQEHFNEERLEKERLEKERLEKERLEKERADNNHLRKEDLEKEQSKPEILEKEIFEKDNPGNERLETKLLEKECLKSECLSTNEIQEGHSKTTSLDSSSEFDEEEFLARQAREHKEFKLKRLEKKRLQEQQASEKLRFEQAKIKVVRESKVDARDNFVLAAEKPEDLAALSELFPYKVKIALRPAVK